MGKRVGILAPMALEMAPFSSRMGDSETILHAGLKMHRCVMANKEVVVAISGTGKVNSAAATQAMIDRFEVETIILSGVAGALGPSLKVGDVLVGSRLQQYDVAAIRKDGYYAFPLSVRSFDGKTFRTRVFESSERLVHMALEGGRKVVFPFRPNGLPQLKEGVIVTGDALLLWPDGLDHLRRTFDAMAIDMEGAAVAQVALANGVEFVAIRGISDIAADLANLGLERLLGWDEKFSVKESVEYASKAAGHLLRRPRDVKELVDWRRAMVGAAENAATVTSALVSVLDQREGS